MAATKTRRGRRQKAVGRNRSRRNPEGASESMYSSFHGVPSTETLEYEQDLHYHGNLAALGELVELKVNLLDGNKAVLTFDTSDGTIDNPGIDRNNLWETIGERTGKDKAGAFTYLPDLSYLKETAKHVLAREASEAWIGTERFDKERKEAIRRFVKGFKHGFKSFKGLIENPGKSNNPFWPFSSFTKSTIYHVGSGRKYGVVGTHKGYSIYKHSDRDEPYFVVPKLDAESRLDTLGDAKKFIDSWVMSQKNPKHKYGPFHAAGKFLSQGTSVVSKPMDQFTDVVGKAGGYLDDQLGRALNPGTNFSLYHLAKEADDEFQQALEKVFGKRAGDMRYQSAKHPAHIKALAKKKHAADELWLKEMRKKNPQVPSASSVMLCSSEDGKSLYLIGGDQSLKLSDLGIKGPAADKDKIVIGDVTHITYRTRKDFDKMSELDYIHEFGEDTHGPLPELVYDRRNALMTLAGGTYFIKTPLLQTSPGIED